MSATSNTTPEHDPDTTAPLPHAISPLDQQLALRAAAERLTMEFTGQHDRETVEAYLLTSYDELIPQARLVNFLPLLAERFARQRLHALARLEAQHADGKPVVLFLCTHNAGRSQMALGFFTHLAGAGALAWSGGSTPGTEVNPAAVTAMAERGIDISAEYPKPWTDEVVRAADVIVTMGCDDVCTVHPGKRYEDWPVADPEGIDLSGVRAIRDDIERRVRQLVLQLDLPRPG